MKLLAILLILIPNLAWASEKLMLEIDPLTFAQNGYSLHMRYKLDTTVVGGGVYALDMPKQLVEMNQNNEGWEARIDSAQILFFDYLFDNKIEGWILGAQITSQNYEVSYDGNSTSYKALSSLTRVGYHYEPLSGSGLYLFPWAGVGKSDVIEGDTSLDDNSAAFDHKATTSFVTLHVGYRF